MGTSHFPVITHSFIVGSSWGNVSIPNFFVCYSCDFLQPIATVILGLFPIV